MMTYSELQELQKAMEFCEQKVFPKVDLYMENLSLGNEDREEFKNNFRKLIECIKSDSEALNKNISDGVQEKKTIYDEIVGEIVVVQNTTKYSWLKKTMSFVNVVNGVGNFVEIIQKILNMINEIPECKALGDLLGEVLMMTVDSLNR